MTQVIFVTGLPRSGTSLVAGVIRACGAFTGTTTGPSPWNPKGNVENEAIRENLLKPYLEQIPACPRGLASLPNLGHLPRTPPARLRDGVQVFLRRQGYVDGPVVYKDAKIALVWRWFAAAFPMAQWVVVRRPRAEIVASVMRAEPMRRWLLSEEEVEDWAAAYERHVDAVAAHAIEITPAAGNLTDLRLMIDWLGLEWDEDAVRDWIDMDLMTRADPSV